MRLPVYKQVWWWGGAGLVLALALWRLGNVMTPFLLGAGIAYVLDPIVDRLEQSGLKRHWAVALITAIVVLVFVAVLLLIVPTLVRQITQAVESAPLFVERAQAIISANFPRLAPEGGTLRAAMSNIGDTIAESGGQVLVTVLSSVGNFLGVMALIVIVPVVAFYLLLDWDHMVARVDELLPREHAPSIRRIAIEIDESLSGFLRGQGLVTLMLGTFYAAALFAVGLPFGLAIGIMAAVLSIIPYVGVFVGGVTAISVALVHFWGEPFWIGAVALIFVIGQIAEGNYLQPKIIGGHVGLHPVWLMIALAVFGTLFGFVGLIVAVPLAAMVGVLARFVAGRYKESALYTGREVPPPPPQPMLIELVPRGTVAETRSRAEAAKAVAVAEVRVEEARREAARVAEETVRESHAHMASATAEVDADPRSDDDRPRVREVHADAADAGDAARGAMRTTDPDADVRIDAVAEAAPPEAEAHAEELRRLARDAASAALAEATPISGGDAAARQETLPARTPAEAAERLFHATEAGPEIVSAEPPRAAQPPEYEKKAPASRRD